MDLPDNVEDYEYINSFSHIGPFSLSQHIYLKGKSTEITLHEIVSMVERLLHHIEHTLFTYLDIEETFNNVSVNKRGALRNG